MKPEESEVVCRLIQNNHEFQEADLQAIGAAYVARLKARFQSRDAINKVGMVISLAGVLLRSAQIYKQNTSDYYLGFALEQLHRHLEELRAEPERIDEFFRLYLKEEEPT